MVQSYREVLLAIFDDTAFFEHTVDCLNAPVSVVIVTHSDNFIKLCRFTFFGLEIINGFPVVKVIIFEAKLIHGITHHG
jgi:hypothetical protein